MAADSAADHTIGAGQYVDVEIRVDLQRREDHEVQLIHRCADHMAGVIRRADLVVEVVVFQRQRRVQIKALDIQHAVNEPFLMHGGDLAGDAAQREAAADVLIQHLLPQEAGGGQRRTTAAHLHGEAVVQVARGFNDIGGGLGNQQLLRILGVAGSPGHDALGIADVVGQHHIVHVIFGNGPRRVGIGHQMVGDDDHVIGILGVGAGIAQRAAGNAVVIVPAVAVGVAVRVTGGRAQKRHIDVQITAADGAGPAAVGAEHHRAVHKATGDFLRQLTAQAGGLNMGDDAIFDMPDKRRMDGSQRGCRQRQVLVSHLRQLVHHHIDDVVAVAEVMVEADGHTVFQSCAADGLLQRRNDFVLLMIPLTEGGGLFLSRPGKRAVVADLIDMGNLVQFYHVTVPPLHRPCCRLRTAPAAAWHG